MTRLKVIFRISVAASLSALFIAMVASRFDLKQPWLVFFDNFHWTICYISAAIFSWIGTRTSNPENAATRKWFFFGLLSATIGQISWDIQVVMEKNPFPAPSDFFFMMFGLSFLIGLFQTIRKSLDSKDIKIALLDAGQISISLITVTLVAYKPISNYVAPLELVVLLAYPIIFFTAACLGVDLHRKLTHLAA